MKSYDKSEIYYTYRIFDPQLGQYIYVGKGKNRRWEEHFFATRKKRTHVQNRIAKLQRNGFQPTVDFVCTGVDEELAILAEMEAIAKYGRRDLKTGHLLNLTDGGEGHSGYIRPQDVCERISIGVKASYADPVVMARKCNAQKAAQNKPETRAKRAATFSDPEWKQKHSAVLREALKEAQVHRRRPCTIDGITIYRGVRELIKALGQGRNGSAHPDFRYV